ncbi:MAG: indolepyruvate ferredoxin oxidoreductase family protein, partial [Burkholderiales bacterium]|nr:indolepyruvate ferredoxin oxidoreductase family protein [Burkholderiales bacterium]
MNAPVEPPPGAGYTLEEKYTRESGRVYLSGIQALVRLPMLQRARDLAAGLDTAGFICGYRGSPLGGYDLELWRAAKHLERQRVRFQPGVNEELAATALWGTQQVESRPGARCDGVFGIWYGKGPGVDRAGDALKHGNAAGSSPRGGVLVLAGDDHGARSSTLAHQSEPFMAGAGIPMLYPASVQEILDYGLLGFALSRYSGCWVSLKLVNDIIESAATVEIDPARPCASLPADHALPAGGLNLRLSESALSREERLLNHRLYAALAFCRANRIDRTLADAPGARLGIVCAGKVFLDVEEALGELGLDAACAAAAGVRILKLGMVWPLETQALCDFARGLEEILVIEEKRPFLENQVKSALYHRPPGERPRVVGKFGESGEWAPERGENLVPVAAELDPPRIAAIIERRMAVLGLAGEALAARAQRIAAQAGARAELRPAPPRAPHFCAGCPHNRSTRVPQGSRALAGIGCHGMATMMNRATDTLCQMGGEGVTWVGQAPFTDEPHVFANLGDGTYYHSGILAVRQAIAAGARITYKLLCNGAVSMTGGQPIEGGLTVAQIAAELKAEGASRIEVVADDPKRYHAAPLPPGVGLHGRGALEAVQRQLREQRGVSVLIFDQMCATEKRRQRKRGRDPEAARRVFINTAVCEGCGDCNEKSNCLAVEPVETALGRKRRINQSSCNQDLSCLEGFCPSLVTVVGGRPRAREGDAAQGARPSAAAGLPAPELPLLAQAPFNVLVAGIGGTGVVTLGAILGTAAHLDGRAVTVLDVTGLAQKYGAVLSHVRIADRPSRLHATRIVAGQADTLLGCDLLVAAGAEVLARMDAGRSRAVVNRALTPSGEFARNPDWDAHAGDLEASLERACGEGRVEFVDAARLALALCGEAVAQNVFLLGYAWQKGWVPLSHAALERAIELNGAAVAQNRDAFDWGRRAAHAPRALERLAQPAQAQVDSRAALGSPRPRSLEELVAQRAAHLSGYQDEALAARFEAFIARIRDAEAGTGLGDAMARAAAGAYFRLLACKDEYEVARLYAGGAFRRELDEAFEPGYSLRLHIGAWPLRRREAAGGEAAGGEAA